jgi:hypothetical protein
MLHPKTLPINYQQMLQMQMGHWSCHWTVIKSQISMFNYSYYILILSNVRLFTQVLILYRIKSRLKKKEKYPSCARVYRTIAFKCCVLIEILWYWESHENREA